MAKSSVPFSMDKSYKDFLVIKATKGIPISNITFALLPSNIISETTPLWTFLALLIKEPLLKIISSGLIEIFASPVSSVLTWIFTDETSANI